MSDSALNHVPLTTKDLVKDIDTSDPAMTVDLNRIQAAHIQEALRKGIVSPEQVVEWKRDKGLMPNTIPDTVSVPARETTALGGRTDTDKPRLADVIKRNFELTDTQQQTIAQNGIPNADTTGV